MQHPARFSDEILSVLNSVLPISGVVLDPFAGTGRIHSLRPSFETWGVEIEPEWASLSPFTAVGNALALPFRDNSFNAICTSPCYGNRLADHHEAKDGSVRRSYRHDLGRPLHPDNAGQLHWGGPYRDFHRLAWREAMRVLKDDGLFVLNVSDHIRGGQVIPVKDWHVDCLEAEGLGLQKAIPVPTKRMRFGTNHHLRVNEEWVLIFG